MKRYEDGIWRGADFSSCRNYRYTLKRTWDFDKGRILFILLNPSTADEKHDDPTNRRGIGFAKLWGYGSIVFCNLFAYRTPHPTELKKAKNPVGPDNDKWILKEAASADLIVAAWGNHGNFMERNEEVKKLVSDMKHLGLTKSGDPKHILYLPNSAKLAKLE